MTGGALDIYRENLKALLRKRYSEIVAEHAVEPRNMCDMGRYSGFGIATSGNGEMMAIWINIEKGVVAAASFTSDGEAPAIAAGSADPLKKEAAATLEAVRNKLRLWGITDEQIKEIEQRGTAEEHMTINAPLTGIVISKHVEEGGYVKTGTKIYPGVHETFKILWI